MKQTVVTTVSVDELVEIIVEKIRITIKEEISFKNLGQVQYSTLTRQEVANYLSITLATVNAWTKIGRLKGYRIGRRVLYKSNEVNDALSAIKSPGINQGK